MQTKWNLFVGLMPLLLTLGLIGWAIWRWVKASDEPLILLVRLVITAIVLGFVFTTAVRAKDEFAKIVALLVGCVGGVIMTIVWRQKFCDFVGDQFASLYTGGNQQVDPKPFYSVAEAKRKQGKYAEAIERIGEQLARFPTDFTGWMLLAEIQAEDLKDLTSARETVQSILNQEGHAPKNIAYALNREADWCLRLAQNREGARAALEHIVERLPESEQAQLALQRLAHLTPQEMLDAQVERPRMVLQHREENIGLRDEMPQIQPPEETPETRTVNLVRHLEEFPYDNEARENLALLYAHHYRRLDLASDQLEQLVSLPNQPAKQVVHWLNLLADIQLELTADPALARATLQRIIERYPKSAAAENALNRTAYLKLELRPKQQSQAIKLGSYEQNLGLRGSSSGPPTPLSSD